MSGTAISPAQIGVPGLDVASATSPEATIVVERMGANDWLAGLVLAREAAAGEVVDAAEEHFEPVRALRKVPDVAAALTRIELDVCGAWVTLSCAGTPQPVVVRRAGWIDLRGQLAPLRASGLADDRVGLGPGDCIVLLGPALAGQVGTDGERFAAECLPTALLRGCSTSSAREVLDEVELALRSFNGGKQVGPVLVLRVPLEAKEQSAQRVAAATGLDVAELKETRYPLGEQLMARRPAPPREARLELTADLSQVSGVRELMRRLLASWRMADKATRDVELLATEITANAIRHGQSPVTLIARYDGKRVRVEVGDAARELPLPRRPDEMDEGGRGMLLVQSLAADWGVVTTLSGKRVWFEVELGPEPA